MTRRRTRYARPIHPHRYRPVQFALLATLAVLLIVEVIVLAPRLL